MRNLTICLLVAGVLTLAPRPLWAGWQVWTVAGTQRVLREETPEGAAVPHANLAAARNEWESFQVLMRSDEPVAGIELRATSLTGPDGAAIAANHVRLYRQHQLHLTDPTYRNDEFRPGWYADPLIQTARARLAELIVFGKRRPW